ncbi:two-component system CitB family response regulator [Kribbella aluminosa]|uniref:Transcriptional regulatory protein n=1 Tax=Kribbella aluminosa TaxID=416017 RepID=A0ABS4UVZ4_9ACTN|nr:response regulator [Kribbella aluminosa]MBP2355827.1 two-component system CitB family response regulator [Kribbella aluminosa]
MKLRVLVVDDDFRVAKLHADAIDTLADCEAIGQARSATDALRLARAQRPDLVLLDEYLPDAPGTTLIGRLGAPCIMITSANDPGTVRRAFGAGAVNYILKPFPIEVLADRVTAYARSWATLTGPRPVDQTQIDHAYAVLHSGDLSAAKGRSQETTALVRDILIAARGSVTAAQVADDAGISRGTAQRYLADLAKTGRVTLTLHYGSTGRPEHHYTWLH